MPNARLEALEEPPGFDRRGQSRQRLVQRTGQPSRIGRAGGRLTARNPGRPVDDPGKAPVQASPILIDMGAGHGLPIQRSQAEMGAGLVHAITGLILVALCPYWS
jgi:hypothetical protein